MSEKEEISMGLFQAGVGGKDINELCHFQVSSVTDIPTGH